MRCCGAALGRYGSATMKARRSPWLDDRAALLVSLLADRHGLTVSEDTARQDISDDLDHVARLARIGRQAAKVYITDDTISKMADRIAAAVAEHQTATAAAGGVEHQDVDVVDLDTERRRRRLTP
ncbi:hypothetical protein BRW65_22820 [Mycobacterium paraffinicum]|uniref:Uncharacterized protein n=2 Tax=Mycobacteriaceae TaxID=1762 RepID=A0A1Q4HP74_9MYCO|nr:hypothetical protein A5689_11615 [Mycobacterium intracellulare subsp. yongonense]OJZ69488.1 hypothetical protein BRW65_22820 [Mycobacterium paraffinicum]